METSLEPVQFRARCTEIRSCRGGASLDSWVEVRLVQVGEPYEAGGLIKLIVPPEQAGRFVVEQVYTVAIEEEAP